MKNFCCPHKANHWFHKSYLIDWAICLVVIVLEQISTLFVVEPYHRFLPDSFQEASYPYLSDTVPTWLLILFCFGLPFLIFGGFFLKSRSCHDLHHAFLGLIEAFVMTVFFTDVAKIFSGRYRPDWYARPQSDKSVIKDGRMSFPSGHASTSFACMAYLSLYLNAKLGVLTRNSGELWKGLITLLPLALAGFVAISRTRDYHHDFSDIIAGAIIGAGFAIYTYHLNFPGLWAEGAYLPKTRQILEQNTSLDIESPSNYAKITSDL